VFHTLFLSSVRFPSLVQHRVWVALGGSARAIARSAAGDTNQAKHAAHLGKPSTMTASSTYPFTFLTSDCANNAPFAPM
jgi:hypothetical protein